MEKEKADRIVRFINWGRFLILALLLACVFAII